MTPTAEHTTRTNGQPRSYEFICTCGVTVGPFAYQRDAKSAAAAHVAQAAAGIR